MTTTPLLQPETMRDRFWELRAERDRIHDVEIKGIHDSMEEIHVKIRELEAQLVPLQEELKIKMTEVAPIDSEMGIISRALKGATAKPE